MQAIYFEENWWYEILRETCQKQPQRDFCTYRLCIWLDTGGDSTKTAASRLSSRAMQQPAASLKATEPKQTHNTQLSTNSSNLPCWGDIRGNCCWLEDLSEAAAVKMKGEAKFTAKHHFCFKTVKLHVSEQVCLCSEVWTVAGLAL